nr:promoter A1 hypothetical protein - Streptomyces aureofaciens [Kitasatospora aureofaciens]
VPSGHSRPATARTRIPFPAMLSVASRADSTSAAVRRRGS